jgi:hypothetical protein
MGNEHERADCTRRSANGTLPSARSHNPTREQTDRGPFQAPDCGRNLTRELVSSQPQGQCGWRRHLQQRDAAISARETSAGAQPAVEAVLVGPLWGRGEGLTAVSHRIGVAGKRSLSEWITRHHHPGSHAPSRNQYDRLRRDGCERPRQHLDKNRHRRSSASEKWKLTKNKYRGHPESRL